MVSGEVKETRASLAKDPPSIARIEAPRHVRMLWPLVYPSRKYAFNNALRYRAANLEAVPCTQVTDIPVSRLSRDLNAARISMLAHFRQRE